jgi:hypothetical protein
MKLFIKPCRLLNLTTIPCWKIWNTVESRTAATSAMGIKSFFSGAQRRSPFPASSSTAIGAVARRFPGKIASRLPAIVRIRTAPALLPLGPAESKRRIPPTTEMTKPPPIPAITAPQTLDSQYLEALNIRDARSVSVSGVICKQEARLSRRFAQDENECTSWFSVKSWQVA